MMMSQSQPPSPRNTTRLWKRNILFTLAVLMVFCALQFSLRRLSAETNVLDIERKITLLSVESSSYPLPKLLNKNKTSLTRNSPSPQSTPPLSGNQTSDFAYVFLLGSVDPTSSWHRGYLWNMMVSSQILNDNNSTADRIAMIHLQTNATPTDEFRQSILHLQQMNVRIWWLEEEEESGFEIETETETGNHTQQNVSKTTHISQDDNPQKIFDQANMLKFHILQLTSYKRLLYLDSDIIPLCNLDYIFELSMSGKIAPNLGISDGDEPANGGFFMVQPKPGDYDHIQNIIRQQKESAKHLPPPHFDTRRGWGHVISGDDQWFSQQNVGQLWNFYAAQSDQGLLYHWLKYVTKDVSLLINRKAKTIYERWGSDIHGNLTRLIRSRDRSRYPFTNHTCLGPYVAARRWKKLNFGKHPSYHGSKLGRPPFSDFIHFYAHFKPWSIDAQVNTTYPEVKSRQGCSNSIHYWFHTLRKVSQRLDLKIDFDNWKDQAERPPFGNGRVQTLT